MARFSALFALVALAASSAPVAAKCAMSHLRPKVVTTAPTVGGGIVVATEQVSYDVKDEGDATQPTWKLEMGGSSSAPKIESLAPGLAVYRLPATAGTATLLDGKTVIAKVTTSKAKPTMLPAPKIKSITHDVTTGRRSSAFTTAIIDGAPPAGAVALVLADAKGTARSFGLVGTDSKITVYAHGRCGVVPNNTVESTLGDKVTLFWVDQSGNKSPASAVIKVGGKPASNDDD